MTLLTVWPEDSATVLHRTTDEAGIRDLLAPIGVRFERWPVAEVPAGAGPDEFLAAYREPTERVIATEGYGTVDVVALAPSDEPGWADKAAAARARFLAEHTHDDAEDRFFARGAGVFYLHVDGKVHAVLCEAGDLISVPAGTTHWFDMGTRPDFAAIRFFHDDDGWVGNFTGSPIASLFPDFDSLMAGHRAASVG